MFGTLYIWFSSVKHCWLFRSPQVCYSTLFIRRRSHCCPRFISIGKGHYFLIGISSYGFLRFFINAIFIFFIWCLNHLFYFICWRCFIFQWFAWWTFLTFWTFKLNELIVTSFYFWILSIHEEVFQHLRGWTIARDGFSRIYFDVRIRFIRLFPIFILRRLLFLIWINLKSLQLKIERGKIIRFIKG